MIESRQIRNPFPGLRPFETDEYRLFFGREGQSDELLSRLQREHFLAVVGTSGSGKSSLIRAGLLPALRGGMMAGAGSGWRIAIMRPGGDPIGNLARELAQKGVLAEAGGGLPAAEAEAAIDATLRSGSLGLVDAARQGRLAENEKLLVVVDQFEELFRFRSAQERTNTGDEASAFVKLLIEASQQRELSIYIVLTMRSDFLGDCAQFQGLPETINDGQYLIPRMTRDERRFAVTGPVGVTRGKITEPLVNRLLNDVGDNPDQLPILQHALMRTWDHWATHRRNGEAIGLEHYEAIGTMSDALSLHADEAFNELPNDRSRLIAETLFKSLSERGADNREIRRPIRLSAICDIAGASMPEVIAVIDVFRGGGRSFLMPPAGVALQPETVIDISHESLIRNWQRLQSWVNEEAQSARIYRRLAEAAVLHREGSEGLLQDPALQIALDWYEHAKPTAAWAERYHAEFAASLAYLEESRAARDATLAEREHQRQLEIERDRRELEQAQLYAAAQARANRKLRLLMVALGIMLVLAMATAAYAFVARRQAQTSERVALGLRDDAVKQQMKIASLLESEKTERQKARDAEKAAEDQATIARDERKRADAARIEAVDALATAKAEKERADKEKRVAETNAEQARIAEAAANSRARALEANGLFRDATILAERADYAQAFQKFEITIERLQEPDISDFEGVADTYVQLGQALFAATEDRGPALARNRTLIWMAKNAYDNAERFYAEKAGSPDKAAAALLSVSETFRKIARDEPVGRLVSRTDRELATLSIKPRGAISTPDAFPRNTDPKVLLKNWALERYKRAFQLYQRSKNVDGMQIAAYKIGAFYLHDELTTEQDPTPALNVEKCAGSEAQAQSNRQKAQCYFEELERLSLAQGRDDAGLYRLLVTIGALHSEFQRLEEAETYFKRAQKAYQSYRGDLVPAHAGDPWSAAADISENEGLYHSAISLYKRALNVYLAAGNYSGVALMFYKQGVVLRKRDPVYAAGYTHDVTDLFKNAVEAYKMHLKKGNAADGYPWVEEFLDIGSHAEEVNNTTLALDAYGLLLALGEARKNLPIQAQAWAEIGRVRTQFTPKEARLSYMKAFTLYSRHRDATEAQRTDESEKAARELRRLSALIESLDKEIRLKAEAAREPLTPEAFCPYPVAVYASKAVHQDGEPVVFNASIAYEGPAKLKFSWTVSPSTAKLFGPDNGRELIVDGTGLGGQRVTATLVVVDEAEPSACRQTAQASTLIAVRKPSRK